jgi:hypothetical protein
MSAHWLGQLVSTALRAMSARLLRRLVSFSSNGVAPLHIRNRYQRRPGSTLWAALRDDFLKAESDRRERYDKRSPKGVACFKLEVRSLEVISQIPQQDDDAAQLHEAEIVLRPPLVAHH